MDVIKRNFFRLLRSGTFGDKEAVEPMSAWKWERLYHISLMHGVAAFVADGIRRHADDFFLQIPPDMMRNWEKTVAEIEEENLCLNRQIAALFTLLNKEQLRPILLKGQSMNEL